MPDQANRYVSKQGKCESPSSVSSLAMPGAFMFTGLFDDVVFLLVCFVLVVWCCFAGFGTTPGALLILPLGDIK